MIVHWTEAALVHLREIENYIGSSSPQAARALVERIFDRTETLHSLPHLGPIVPEYDDDSLRELFERPYRIVYRILANRIDVLAVHHGARLLPSRI